MPFGELRSIRNLGQLSANEIQEKLEMYLQKAHDNPERRAMPASSVSTEQILSVMHSYEFELVDMDTILQALPNATEDDVKAILASLVDSQKVIQSEDTFAIKHISFFETVNALSLSNPYNLDERAVRILQQRASGKTLEEVGQQEGATRERIRQIEKKALDKFTCRGHVIYEEDRYAYLFSTYAFEREFYFDYLDESKNIWNYLNFRYARGKADIAGALNAQPGMKQQTFVAAAFSAGAGTSAGSIGYGEELVPTLKGSASGNCMPSVLCLNDQGGSVMECSENVSGTLRAQEHGHQPLVYENHGIDARYTGPHQVAPTMSARYGTGGNNVPLVEQEETFCITGNAIDRQPQNGGNGIGYQRDIAYTLTATDHLSGYPDK